jgi:TonB family protein
MGATPRRIFLCLLSVMTASIATSQQPSAASSQPQSVGQRAVNVVLQQSSIDPTVLVQKTGQPLPANGQWLVGKEAPTGCPQSETCVRIFYRIPEAEVSCQWTVGLTGNGSSGVILDENEDAARYLLRKVPPSEAAAFVVARKQPIYPPIAAAAHVQGPVVLRLFVSNTGVVEKALIVSGPDMLRATSIDAAKQWIFKAPTVGTEAVRFETDVTFDFKTSGLSSSRVTSKP